MKLVKQTRLKFQDSKSDKVYEVDLCDAGNGKYLVNFRYGRRGANLKEGTKTEEPVTLEKAEKLFDSLVNSKTKKGYKDANVSSPKIALTEIGGSMDDREKSILNHLKLAVENPAEQKKKNWNINRVIWRAGELKIKSAVPYLYRLHDKGNDLHTYSAIWAMGRCGAGKEAADILNHYRNGNSPEQIKRISTAVLLDISSGSEKNKLVDSILLQLPTALREKIQDNNFPVFKNILNEFVNVRQTKKFDFLVDIYLLSSVYPQIQKPLVEIIKNLSFQPPYFKSIRSIFKLAEYRGDGQMFGTLAYRFEKQNPMFHKSTYSSGVWAAGGWIKNVAAELKKPNSKIAYSNKTKSYFNRRIWRWLNKLAEEKDVDYVKTATGILLSYSQKDYKRPTKDVRWNYSKKSRRYHKKTTNYDSFSDSLLLNYILYANSKRYRFDQHKKNWICVDPFKPGMPAPKEREEACPELWDKMPKAYIHLLAESELNKIHEFALPRLQDHKEYKSLTKRIGSDLIIRFIEKEYNPTAKWGLKLAKGKYDRENPDRKLTLAMIGSNLEAARQLAKKWIAENHAFYFSDTDFILSMTVHKFKDIRDWMKKDMPVITKNLTPSQKQVLVGRIVSHMMNMDGNKNNNELAKEYAENLLLNFSETTQNIGFDIIRDLLKHPLEENKKFAGELTLRHSIPAEKLPQDVFNSFLNSKHDYLREVGIKLFGQFSDNTLLGRQDELIKYATSKLDDVRKAVKPVIKKLAQKHPSFAEDCVNKFVPVLLRKETYEGVHEDVYGLLTQELEKHLSVIERKKIFRLLNSEHNKAQELGTVLVDKYIPAESLSVSNIVRLGNHEIKACREICQRMFRENVARMKYEREEALRIMDSNWDDTREFAFGFFRKEFQEKDWTPELLVSICDSVRPDVSAFGRELITKFFKEEHGTQYLLQLSQHPTNELQLFATNYLERFASDDLEKLKKLEFYFITVLSQVNKGRTAKNRVLNFLRKEAMKLPEAAEIVARILDRLSLTIAIGDKSSAIEIMRDIHEKYPHIEVPISLKPVSA